MTAVNPILTMCMYARYSSDNQREESIRRRPDS